MGGLHAHGKNIECSESIGARVFAISTPSARPLNFDGTDSISKPRVIPIFTPLHFHLHRDCSDRVFEGGVVRIITDRGNILPTDKLRYETDGEGCLPDDSPHAANCQIGSAPQRLENDLCLHAHGFFKRVEVN